jgi:arabinose-5-phosphate isomerase
MLEAAKSLLIAESEAIGLLAGRLDHNFRSAVEILLAHVGKTVICGIGKSGHIAKKIAATFSSVGQPSVFLHPAEAAHGDLGVYSQGDPTILLSKSGTTDEILCIAPILKKFQSKIISILGNANSPIADLSDVVIDISFAKESDPLQIVPTTSAIVTLAVGDALAAELMARRNFSKLNFASLHPAGQLGRNLLLRVDDLMTGKSSCAIVGVSSTLREVVIAMTEYPLGAALVTDSSGSLIGIVTEGDIRRSLIDRISLEDTRAGDIMTTSPKCIASGEYLGEAVKIMESGASQLSVLPVVAADQSSGRPMAIGLLRIHDSYRH